MNESFSRISRVQSLIDKDLENVSGSSTLLKSDYEATGWLGGGERLIQGNKNHSREYFKRYQQAVTEKRQRYILEQERLRIKEEKRVSIREQKDKKNKLRRYPDRKARQKRRQQFRQGTLILRTQSNNDKDFSMGNQSIDALLLTQLVQKGHPSQFFSIFDARRYSESSNRKSYIPRSQRNYITRPVIWFLGFLFEPLVLVSRFISLIYRFVNSIMRFLLAVGKIRFSGRKISTSNRRSVKFFLILWHFITAPFHRLAHIIIDPLGIFTREPHNYARMFFIDYVRIFTLQTVENTQNIPRKIYGVGNYLFFFLLSPLLLLFRILFSPYHYSQYGTFRILLSITSDRLKLIYRLMRIRIINLAQFFRTLVASRYRKQLAIFRSGVVNGIRVAVKIFSTVWIILKQRTILGLRYFLGRLKKISSSTLMAVNTYHAFLSKLFASVSTLLCSNVTSQIKVDIKKMQTTLLKNFLKPFSTLHNKGNNRPFYDMEDTVLDKFLAANKGFGNGSTSCNEYNMATAKSDGSGVVRSDREAAFEGMDTLHYQVNPKVDNNFSEQHKDKGGGIINNSSSINENDNADIKNFKNNNIDTGKLFKVDSLDEGTRSRFLRRLSKQIEEGKLR